MSQDKILNYLKEHKGIRFTAEELKLMNFLGKSIYPNLVKLSKDTLSGIKCKVRVSLDTKRKKEFIYYYENDTT